MANNIKPKIANYGTPIRPVDKQFCITLPFGAIDNNLWPTHCDHAGTDFSTPVGSPVYAVEDGVIVFAQEDPAGWGHYIVLQSGKDFYIYGHLSEWKVKQGDRVKQGQVIGLTGNTGNSTGPHLHFEHRYGDMTRDSVKPVVFFNEDGAYYH